VRRHVIFSSKKVCENALRDRTMGEVRHILALSGGKDSSALAVFMKDKVPQMEYVFCDTGDELAELIMPNKATNEVINISVDYIK